MKKLFFALLIIGLAGCSGADNKASALQPPANRPMDFDAVKTAAMKGDYQAQRNVAFGYSSTPYKGQDKNPILGCAWYRLIILSGSDKVNNTDVNNVAVYCDKLKPVEREAAEAQAKELHKKIYR